MSKGQPTPSSGRTAVCVHDRWQQRRREATSFISRLLSPQSKTLVYHQSMCCSFLSLPPEGETHWDRWEVRSKTNSAITVIWMKDERKAVHSEIEVLWEESQFKQSINDHCNHVFLKNKNNWQHIWCDIAARTLQEEILTWFWCLAQHQSISICLECFFKM